MSNLVQLRRYDTSTPWGFRMNGGREFGQPLYIQKVTPNSVSHKAGLRPGDVILQIGPMPAQGMTHQQAKMEIIRAGNDVDFFIQRNGMNFSDTGDSLGPPVHTPPTHYSQSHDHSGSGVVEEPHWRSGRPMQDPRVQSQSFKMLQHQLASE